MATYHVQVATAADSLLSRDRIVNTFHLDDHGVTSDPDGLAEDTAGLWTALYGNNREHWVRVYNTGTGPNFPVGEFRANPNTSQASHGPREVALCLSYYGERNLPRTRGRIYTCAAIAANYTMDSVRPNGSAQTQLLELATGISNLGGADVDWIYWSTIDGSHGPVKHAYVDDEWDTIRSRGLRPDGRATRDFDE